MKHSQNVSFCVHSGGIKKILWRSTKTFKLKIFGVGGKKGGQEGKKYFVFEATNFCQVGAEKMRACDYFNQPGQHPGLG